MYPMQVFQGHQNEPGQPSTQRSLGGVRITDANVSHYCDNEKHGLETVG